MEAKTGIWVVALTGASGMKYALRLLEVAAEQLQELHVIVSEAGLRVLQEEEGLALSASRLSTERLLGHPYKNIFFHNIRDIGASIASGSFRFDGMVIVPCSTGTLGAIANGIITNLIHRVADVVLKERRRLIIVPRETPLSTIQIKNLLALSESGAVILPAMPGLYHQPNSISDLVDMLVMKILDQMGIVTELVKRWGADDPKSERPTSIPPHMKVVEIA